MNPYIISAHRLFASFLVVMSCDTSKVRNGMHAGMINGMTAISVDDALMEDADTAARDLGLSRSRLIADALRDYLRKRRGAWITQQLNEAYPEASGADRRLVQKLRMRVQNRW